MIKYKVIFFFSLTTIINIRIQDRISINFELKATEEIYFSFNFDVLVKFHAFRNPQTSINFESGGSQCEYILHGSPGAHKNISLAVQEFASLA